MIKPTTEAAVFAIPGDLSTPTGGYEYARRLLQALPGLNHLQLPSGFPHPSERDLTEASARLAAVPSDTILLIDGLAFGVLPEAVLDTIRGPIVALIHHPLCLESGLSEAACDALRRSEQVALGRAAHVIATSQCTADWLSRDFGVPASRITIAEPGTIPARRARGTGYPPHLLTVGSVVPRKGYDLLVQALSRSHRSALDADHCRRPRPRPRFRAGPTRRRCPERPYRTHHPRRRPRQLGPPLRQRRYFRDQLVTRGVRHGGR